MTEQTIYLTRRKVLGAVGAVGAASAGAGLSTSAFFSDTEEFSDNTIAAGEFDLKVDWQQRYYGPAEEAFFVNAHPDHDGDGIQSLDLGDIGEVSYTDHGRNIVDVLTCETPEFDDNYDFTAPERSVEMGGPITEQESLVSLRDVKPGDWGEITFSLHLCDNPGYLWMTGEETSNEENGYEEPEPDTEEGGDTQSPGAPEGAGELAENIEVEMWYDDDCDNELDVGETADIMFTLDASGSMFYERYGGLISEDPITVDGVERAETAKIDLVERGVRQFLQALINASPAPDVQVGVVFFDGFDPDDGSLDDPQLDVYGLQDPGDLDDTLGNFRGIVASLTGGGFDPSDGSGVSTGTALTPGIEAAQMELDNNGRGGAQPVDIIFTDGEPYRDGSLQNSYFDEVEAAADDARSSSPTPATDVYVIGDETSDSRAQELVLEMAGEAGSPGGDASHLFELTSNDTIPQLFQRVALLFLPENVFFEGTLAEALNELEEGEGIPLDANRFLDSRNEFLAGMTRCVGFRWQLPLEVGNEVQGDGITFDLGFYGEQARHNEV